ncbi:class I SAM-dependent methyltransferase [Paenibacillus sp. MER 180]|uniref:tRNA (adenine(22)-N(1))-methyltransferase n=1 Tax=Paenibacillus sp. MER 180 TaxID=2939570 RepID=UPI00203C0F5E|nr:class I SAM-dependent methyltransferase [Paenibacillus sp. MER 180]MCM3289313.1 class I SAM-dependent methyltransferase [Paenibacillus sp. MER 180]
MNIKLSKRLQWIADWVPEGSKLADIGSDHALLPSYLAKQGIISYGVAGEVNQGPYEAARRQVLGSRLENIVQVRLGDGLAVLEPNEVDCISIAGMGGSLIVSILSTQPEKLEGVKRLILQPNVGEDTVRRWLRKEGWALLKEHILEEDGKIYEVLLAERQFESAETHNARLYESRPLLCGKTLSEEWLLQFGPLLSQAPTDVFFEKWKREVAKRERVLRTMEQAESEEAKQRREVFVQNKAELEAIIECLRKGQQ